MGPAYNLEQEGRLAGTPSQSSLQAGPQSDMAQLAVLGLCATVRVLGWARALFADLGHVMLSMVVA